MRLRTIDGLRGVAALAVVLYHLAGAAEIAFENWVGPRLQGLLSQGFLGVEVFFVLSGFVIPYSLRNLRLNLTVLGRFILRRSIRLDPPYWFAIFLELGVMWLGLRLALADTPIDLSWAGFAANLFYLQNLLGFGDLLTIAWTLCFEIQFYVGFVALLVAGEAVQRCFGPAPARVASTLVLVGLFLVSVFARYDLLGVALHPGFALNRWFQFFMGTCVYWTVVGTTSWRPLVATWVVVLFVLVASDQSTLQLVPVVTSAFLWWSWRRDRMSTVLSGSAIQFLGAISYSLYLYHSTVGWRWVRLVGGVAGAEAPLIVALFAFASGAVIAICFAWVMWRILERPSQGLSKLILLHSAEG